MKKAFITGITGQDGAYLAEFLLRKGYEVHGMVRRSSLFNRSRIEHLYYIEGASYKERLHLHYGDLSDSSSINRFLDKHHPDEIYNLGAQSHVAVSFEVPEYTGDVTGIGTLRILDAIRETKIKTKFYQASSSELYGKVVSSPQDEQTPFNPRSPYACAKAYSFYITKNYREAYGMFACNGILFNHESPLRGENFVTRKITLSFARIKEGLQEQFELGNLNASRDWGFAGDYVEAMWLMLQEKEPDDFVVATGETHTVREFAEKAAGHLGFELIWEGEGINERGVDRLTKKTVITVNPSYFRPSEVDYLIGNAAKARSRLNWTPKCSFEKLVEMMVKSDHDSVLKLKYGIQGKA
ncbi:MAG: GDP-mannose 4,6-dehydratase [Bacteroidetes bacterium]|nr:GDP-mannose 4,6-dehydratase [Bacteroidota bacterium]